MSPCGPGNDQCGPPKDPKTMPAFHVKDLTCDENDPNFPFFDEVHGMYHLMYQDHLCIPGGHGPDIGHVVSRDFVHWAHLPVSIWNDQWYDNQAIFTGSATVVDGKPYIVYPGLCDKSHPGCVTYADYAIAVPSNASDPFYTNWSKPAFNPIINGTSDDPSTAWQTPHGEWRLIGNSPAVGQKDRSVAPIFAASSFEGPWKLVGDQTGFAAGECPSFFPLPGLYKGTSAEGTVLPTHVHKRGHGSPGCNGDCMQLGTYKDGVPGEVGTWTATEGVPFDEVLIDHGAYYASKDFYDKPNNRRINWGWATVPSGTQSMARVLTYHPQLKQLVYSPAPEYDQLHGACLTDVTTSTPLVPFKPSSLGDWPQDAGKVSDITVTFKRPTRAASFGVSVLSGSLTVFVDYVPESNTSQVGIMKGPPPSAPPPPVGTVGNGTCGATNYRNDCNTAPKGAWHPKDYNITSLAECAAHARKEGCKMASYVSFSDVPGNEDCSWYLDCDFSHLCEDCSKCGIGCPKYYPYQSEVLKNSIRASPNVLEEHTYGMKASLGADFLDRLQLLPTDDSIELRIFVDRQVVEAYWNDGRVAMTIATAGLKSDPNAPQAQAYTTAAGVEMVSAKAYVMKSIWVTPEEVLATPRR